MIEIYGASDDLIEIDGDLYDEIPSGGDPAVVLVSTGDVLRFRLEEEGWRASVLVNVSDPSIEFQSHDGDHVYIDHSEAPVLWVAVCNPQHGWVKK